MFTIEPCRPSLDEPPHRDKRVLATEKHAVEIGAMHGAPVIEGRMLRIVRCSGLEARDTGVVDEHLQPAAGIDDLGYSADPVCLLADIQLQPGSTQPPGRCPAGRFVNVADEYPRTLAHERRCNSLADAASGARNQRDLLLKSSHDVAHCAACSAALSQAASGGRGLTKAVAEGLRR